MSKLKKAGKGIGIGTIVAVVLLLALGIFGGFASNETENWTIIQRPWDIGGGEPDVGDGKILVENEKNPFIFKCFGTEATYPDNVTEFFSSKDDEGGESGDTTKDTSVKVVFKDKGTASFSAQVVYETPTMIADQVEFHKLAKDDMRKASKTVQTALNQACRFVASGLTASEFIEGQELVVQKINDEMKSNELLKNKWHIDVVDVQISDISPDDMTLQLFAKQQEALLNAKTAEAKKSEYDMKKIETDADYSQKIAEAKGKAEMEKMKAVTDAEREAELARIEAQKKVTVAELAKAQADQIRQKMAIDADAKLQVATIEKQEAEQKAEAIKLLAKAEEERIKLAGAITEKEQKTLEIAKERDIGVANAWANGNRLTPDFVIGGNTGGSDANNGDLNNTLLSLKLMESMNMIDGKKVIGK